MLSVSTYIVDILINKFAMSRTFFEFYLKPIFVDNIETLLEFL